MILSYPIPDIRPALQVVQQLGAQLGFTIKLSSPLQKDMLYIQGHGLAPRPLLGLVADALGATILKTKDGYTLERTAKDLQRLHAARAEKREKWINARVSRVVEYRQRYAGSRDVLAVYTSSIREQALQQNAFTSGHINVSPNCYASQNLPSEVLLEGLIERIGVDVLADLPSGVLQTFEDEPSFGAVKPPDHQDLSQAYVDASESISKDPLPPDIVQMAQRVGQTKYLGMLSSPSLPVKLRLEVMPDQNGFNFFLEGYDAKGSQVLNADLWARPTEHLEAPGTFLRAAKSDQSSQWVHLSQEGRACLQYMAGNPSKLIPFWFLNPDKFEPLNCFVKEAVAPLAAEEHMAAVFVVSDSFWGNVSQIVDGDRISLDALKQTMKVWTPYERFQTKYGIVLRPIDIEEDEANRADRHSLAAFTHHADETGGVDLHAIATLYHDSCERGFALPGTWSLIAQTQLGRTYFSSDCSDNVFRLLGAVPEEGWDRLLSGQSLTVGDCKIQPNVENFFRSTYRLRAKSSAAYPPILAHPLEDLSTPVADGLPIRLVPSDAMYVQVQGSQLYGWTGENEFPTIFHMQADDFIKVNGNIEAKTSRDSFEQTFSKMHFKVGRQKIFQVQIGLENQMYFEGAIQGTIQAESTPVEYSELPQAFRDNVWRDAYAVGLGLYQSIMSSAQSNANPPPTVGSSGSPQKP